MPAGVLSTILDTTGERVKERIAQSEQLDKEMRDTQTKVLLDSIHAIDDKGNPKLSPPEIDEAWAKIEKLHSHNKGVKDIIGKARDVGDKIRGIFKPNPAQSGRLAHQTADVLSGGNGGSLVQPPPTTPLLMDRADDGTSVSTPYTPPPPVRKLPVQEVAAAASQMPTPPPKRSMGNIIQSGSPAATKLSGETAIENVKAKNQKDLKAQEEAAAERIAKLKLAAPTKIGEYTGDDGLKHYTMKALNVDTGQMEYFEQDSSGQVRPVSGKFSPGTALSVIDARDLHEARPDIPFLAMDGKPIDFDSLKLGQKLVPDPTKPNHYAIATQAQTRFTADNVVQTVPSLNAGQTPTTPLGTANVGTTGTSEQPYTNVNTGQTELVTTQRTTTPNKVAPPAAGGPTPPPARTSGPLVAPATPAAVPKPAGAPQSRVLPGLMKSQDLNVQRKFVAPIKSSAVQIFGDPDNPNFKSLEDYAKLADDPQSVKRVGSALRLILDDLAAVDSKGGGIGASVLGQGASVNGGDLWTAIKNVSGLTNMIGTSQVVTTQRALDALKPEEKEYLNRAITAYGTVVGLRSATGGGAYQFSVKNMEKELPLLGITVNDSKSYYGKSAALAEEIITAVKNNGLNSDLLPQLEYYKEAANRLAKLGRGGTAGGPTPPPTRSGSKSVTMVDSKGKAWNVPEDQVSTFEQNGYKKK